jgi:hypothetical protein
MKIEIERQLADGRTVYMTTVSGQRVRATTRNGVKGAERIFAFIGNSNQRQSSPVDFTRGDT